MSTQPKPRLTPEQYLEIERAAEFKSEYYDGDMYAMAGAKWNHNLLAWQLTLIIGRHLAGPCRGVGSDQRVLVPAAGLYTYPDLTVVCGKAHLDSSDNLTNPALIAEILSPSTEAYDRGRKFEHYRTINSLRDYLLIAQDRVRVDLYTRQNEETWVLSSASSLDATLHIPSIDCQLSLRELYAEISFE